MSDTDFQLMKERCLMDLVDRVDADLKAAMLASAADKVSALRMLKADLIKTAIDTRQEKLKDPQAMEVVRRQIKQRKESLEAFQAGKRQDLVDKESKELTLLEAYLPPQMTEEALRAIVEESVAASGAAGPKDMGKVMRMVMERAAGQADGKWVSQMVNQALSKGAA
ncbi:MAG: GatB/YqeY domain-containing protein [Candidatus Omnitrophica bacterium]|nr:GatB/YqeY domain-containing protein [Candidatus Omnitrophota bacterium]